VVSLKTLSWESVLNKAGKKLHDRAYILPEMLPEVLEAEGQGLGEVNKKIKLPKQEEGSASLFNTNDHHYCRHGPEAADAKTADEVMQHVRASEEQPGGRGRTKTWFNGSIKCGCKFGFDIRTFSPGMVPHGLPNVLEVHREDSARTTHNEECLARTTNGGAGGDRPTRRDTTREGCR
jgi:hypothetical protein